jgi:opacity protein-like surface antigen
MRPTRAFSFMIMTTVLVIAAVRPALADATLFIGANTTPSSRMVKGFAVGLSLLIVGFEFEYAYTSDDAASNAPSLKTGMGNVLLQTPTAIFRVQPYATVGGGVYREELGPHEETDVGMNLGGGAKITLVGPLKARLDYRVFKLAGGALNSPAHRFYAGLTLGF